MTKLTFEDFKPGHFGTYGPRHVTRDEIVAFARAYDPQPMHLDEAAAEASILKGLSGSGWHMCALMMRMVCDGFILNTVAYGSPGCNEMRWLAPFRPGDDLTLDVEVLEARPSQSRPSTGIVTFKNSMRNATGQVLAEMTVVVIIARAAVTAS
jgi:acyl dehydratase